MKDILENFVLDESLFPLPLIGEKKRFLIEKNEKWELVLMVWGKESQTPIHDHGGSACWARLLKGQLSEKTFLKEPLIFLSETAYSIGQITYVDEDKGVHQLTNSSQEIAFTVHLYMKPLHYCNVYDALNKDWAIMGNHYDSLEGFAK